MVSVLQFKKNYNEKLKKLDTEKVKGKEDLKKRYHTVYLLIKNNEKIINLQFPEEVFDLIVKNTKWKDSSYFLEKYDSISSIIGVSDKKLHETYTKHRKEITNRKNNTLNVNVSKNLYSNEAYKKFIIRLYTNYPPIRSDYSLVFLKNYDKTKDNYYENNTIYFNTMVKQNPKKVFSVQLNKEDYDFLNKFKTKETMLFPYNGSNVLSDFNLFVNHCSETILNISANISDYRKRYFKNCIKEASKMTFNKGYDYLLDVSKKCNTSIEVINKYK